MLFSFLLFYHKQFVWLLFAKLANYFELHYLLVLKKLLSQVDSHKAVVDYIALCSFVY